MNNSNPPERTVFGLPSESWRRIIALLFIVITIGFIYRISIFKLMDRDFWWHIKSGEIMMETKSMIRVEPFAYTREGQPNWATHEWLSEIAFHLIYKMTGDKGAVLFRFLMITLACLVLLWIDPKRIWFHSLIVIYAANVARPGMMVRPQLFTYAFFCVSLLLATRFIELRESADAQTNSIRKKIVAAMVILQIPWVNFHGGASFMGVLVLGTLLTDDVIHTIRKHGFQFKDFLRDHNFNYLLQEPSLKVLAGGFVLSLMASLISPNTFHNYVFLFRALTEMSSQMIGEWQPRGWPTYLKELGGLWTLFLLSFVLSKPKRLFSLLIACGFGYMAFKAFRHEMLFTFASTAMIIFNLKHSPRFHQFLNKILRHWMWAIGGMAVLFLLLFVYTNRRYMTYAQRDQLHGFGAFEPGKGVYDFIQKEGIHGRLFNTYGIGGYFAYRGHPKMKIYIDGRSVEHGFDFMYKTYSARTDKTKWKKLEEEFGFTYAVIDYDAIKENQYIPYSVHLDDNSTWKLVYVDDWTSLYLKDVLLNKELIAKYEYKILTPTRLVFGRQMGPPPSSLHQEYEQELNQAIMQNPDGIFARLELARLYLSQSRTDKAREQAEEAKRLRPRRAEVFEILGSILVKEKKWLEAARMYDKAVELAGASFENINYDFIANLFEKGGDENKAKKYKRLSGKKEKDTLYTKKNKLTMEVQQIFPVPNEFSPYKKDERIKEKLGKHHLYLNRQNPKIPSPSRADQSEEKSELANQLLEQLTEGLNQDLLRYNNEGVDWAKKGETKKAKDLFSKALEIDPNYPEALNNLGSVYYEEGDLEKAKTYYKKAIAGNPSYGDAHFNLSRTLAKLGETDKAIDHAKKAGELGRDATRLLDILNQLKK